MNKGEQSWEWDDGIYLKDWWNGDTQDRLQREKASEWSQQEVNDDAVSTFLTHKALLLKPRRKRKAPLLAPLSGKLSRESSLSRRTLSPQNAIMAKFRSSHAGGNTKIRRPLRLGPYWAPLDRSICRERNTLINFTLYCRCGKIIIIHGRDLRDTKTHRACRTF